VLLDKPIPNDIGYFTISNSSPGNNTPPNANGTGNEPVAGAETIAPGHATPAEGEGTQNKTTREYDFAKFTDPRGLQPDPTDRLTFKLTPDELTTFSQSLPKTAKAYLSHRRPAPPSMEDLLQRANIQLQQIQFNQLRQSTGP
jgi:hypothetical protein